MEAEGEINQNLPKTIFVRSYPDYVLTEARVLENLLTSESYYHSQAGDYMEQVQRNILSDHRKVVTDWMLEVCQLQLSSSEVFLSSVHFLDVFLSQISVRAGQLQLLASACLSIAAKLHHPQPPSLTDFVILTDCSITIKELQSMELLVLTKLRWELSSPSSLQFLHLLLLKMRESLADQITTANIEKEAETFLMLAATEYKFHKIKPSVLVRSSQPSTHPVNTKYLSDSGLRLHPDSRGQQASPAPGRHLQSPVPPGQHFPSCPVSDPCRVQTQRLLLD